MASRHGTHVERLAAEIASGVIPAGTRLPAQRDYAHRHAIAPGTVARIYAELAERGLVTGEVGRGTFARPPRSLRDVGGTPAPDEAAGAPLREPGLIDLTLNYPLLPGQSDDLRRVLARLGRDQSSVGELMSYQPHGGARADRERFARWAAQVGGFGADPGGVVLTQGGQHGIALALATLCRPGDRLACEELTYPGLKVAAETFGIELVPVATDARHGLDPAALDEACARIGRVRAVYCMPTVQNPLGAVMPEARRRELVAVARRRDLIVIEDAAYAFLEPSPPAAVAALAPERAVYLDTFSKVIAPGLRVGYAATARPDLAAALARGMRATTWSATPLSVAIVSTWLEDGTARRLVDEKRSRAGVLQKLLRATLSPREEDAAFLVRHPHSYHAWVRLAPGWRADDFATALAATERVVVTPARAFAVAAASRPRPVEAVRIAFGGLSDGSLVDGLSRMKRRLDDPFALQIRGA